MPRTGRFGALDGGYDTVCKVGEGICGEVFLVQGKETKHSFALKRLYCKDDNELNQALEDFSIVRGLCHPKLVRYHKIFVKKHARSDGPGFHRYACFVMDYYPEGNLKQCIDANTPLSTSTVARFGKHLTDGLQFLHSKGVVHRDLRPENVLIAEQANSAQLADYGLVRVATAERRARAGGFFYMAPEHVHEKFTDKSDMFSLGLVLCEMMAPSYVRNLKYPQLDLLEDETKFRSKMRAALEQTHAHHPTLIDAAMALLYKVPAQRLSAAQLLPQLLEVRYSLAVAMVPSPPIRQHLAPPAPLERICDNEKFILPEEPHAQKVENKSNAEHADYGRNVSAEFVGGIDVELPSPRSSNSGGRSAPPRLIAELVIPAVSGPSCAQFDIAKTVVASRSPSPAVSPVISPAMSPVSPPPIPVEQEVCKAIQKDSIEPASPQPQHQFQFFVDAQQSPVTRFPSSPVADEDDAFTPIYAHMDQVPPPPLGAYFVQQQQNRHTPQSPPVVPQAAKVSPFDQVEFQVHRDVRPAPSSPRTPPPPPLAGIVVPRDRAPSPPPPLLMVRGRDVHRIDHGTGDVNRAVYRDFSPPPLMRAVSPPPQPRVRSPSSPPPPLCAQNVSPQRSLSPPPPLVGLGGFKFEHDYKRDHKYSGVAQFEINNQQIHQLPAAGHVHGVHGSGGHARHSGAVVNASSGGQQYGQHLHLFGHHNNLNNLPHWPHIGHKAVNATGGVGALNVQKQHQHHQHNQQHQPQSPKHSPQNHYFNIPDPTPTPSSSPSRSPPPTPTPKPMPNVSSPGGVYKLKNFNKVGGVWGLNGLNLMNGQLNAVNSNLNFNLSGGNVMTSNFGGFGGFGFGGESPIFI